MRRARWRVAAWDPWVVVGACVASNLRPGERPVTVPDAVRTVRSPIQVRRTRLRPTDPSWWSRQRTRDLPAQARRREGQGLDRAGLRRTALARHARRYTERFQLTQGYGRLRKPGAGLGRSKRSPPGVCREGPDRSHACGDHRRATTTSVTVAPMICGTTPRMAIGSVVRAAMAFGGKNTSEPPPAIASLPPISN